MALSPEKSAWPTDLDRNHESDAAPRPNLAGCAKRLLAQVEAIENVTDRIHGCLHGPNPRPANDYARGPGIEGSIEAANARAEDALAVLNGIHDSLLDSDDPPF